MTDYALLVIGSGPGGVATAIAYRDAGGAGDVLVLTADAEMPYERPPLSKEVLRGETGADEIGLHADDFYAQRRIAFRRGATATALDPTGRTVTVDDGEQLGFATCVIATGATPQRPELPGVDLEGVHVLRSLAHGGPLRQAAAGASSAVVVGSGFIGCEAAASLAAGGVAVTLVGADAHPQQARLGLHAARAIEGWLSEAGVTLCLEDGLAGLERSPDLRVRTESGLVLPADLVLLATGSVPHSGLAEAAGLRTEDGRIRVDASMRTSAEGVFAVGDVALATNASAGRPVAVEHWGDALAMGEIAGRVAAGEDAEWAQSPGFWSVIGGHTLKYSAWGDGYDHALVDSDGDAFTVWYLRGERIVGVLTHEADDDYDRGAGLVENGASARSLPSTLTRE